MLWSYGSQWYELRGRGPKITTTRADAETFDAGGHLKPDPYYQIGILAAEYGVEAAEEVAEFEMKHLLELQSFIEREKIECDLDVNRVLDVQFDDEHCAKTKAGYDLLRSQGATRVKEVEFSPPESAEAVRMTHAPLSQTMPDKRG